MMCKSQPYVARYRERIRFDEERYCDYVNRYRVLNMINYYKHKVADDKKEKYLERLKERNPERYEEFIKRLQNE